MPKNETNRGPRLSRRRLLGMGAGAAALGTATVATSTAALAGLIEQEAAALATSPGFFGRMFPNLPPFATTQQPTLQRVIDAIRGHRRVRPFHGRQGRARRRAGRADHRRRR